MSTSTDFERRTVRVVPGAETTTTLTVRNDSDIVEAYGFEVVGECAPWTEVEPARLSLYPGTSQPVLVRLRPPRSPSVRAGETPLGIRVLPVERPDSVVVSETVVDIAPFAEQRLELVPERRRAWRSARYRVLAHNDGNTPVALELAAIEVDDRLRYTTTDAPTPVEPGAEAEIPVRVRVGKVLWFGKPVTWPIRLGGVAEEPEPREHELAGEFIQLPVFPRWLLALLGLLLALLLAWLLLVRPAVRSAAREAVDDRAEEIAEAGQTQGQTPVPPPPPPTTTAPEPGGGDEVGEPGADGNSAGGAGTQSSSTIEVRTNTGGLGTGTYVVPEGKVFRVTDILVGNHQGDEGVLTIVFGERTVTTIALETFRNQDYHWVTPIDIPAGAAVTVNVTCAKPGTPATGRQARNCFEMLNVSGELADLQ
ncbi:hypothetical protein JOD54_005042 [Actinokineospora baliensis]|uniref:COG1470 family protein n=1 Tax=Actinokineospora baliensis TaxID=547056 RepID=UPI00195DEFBB|nr:hydrolytic protein [Actinokineospora baliensis]MBM7774838.1 hypothetical protein [Actinokineospora baliensis]